MQLDVKIEALLDAEIAHLDMPVTCNWVDDHDEQCEQAATWTCACVLCKRHTGLLCDMHHGGAMQSPDIYFHYACVAEGTFAEITTPTRMNEVH